MRVSGDEVEITIDKEFAAMIPPLSAEERQQLEENIVEHGGARDPLVVWIYPEWTPEGCSSALSYGSPDSVDDGSLDQTLRGVKAWYGDDGDTYFCSDWPRTLLDGHNRYEICTRLELPFDIHEMEFKRRDDAEDWIDKNQLGRRNLDSRQMSLLRGRRYNRTKKTPQQSGALKGKGSDILSEAQTAEALAAEHGVSSRTIERDGEFAEAVETLGIERQVVSGQIDAPKHEIVAAFKSLPEKPTQEQVAEAVEAVKARPHVSNNSGDNEWYTPAEYINAARSVLGGFDLDPASNPVANEVVGAEEFYTAESDGLSQEWAGRVWMNPPYESGLIGRFAEKLCETFEAGDVTSAVVLVNNATETRWFQAIAAQASAVCFPKGRVKFWHPRKEAVPLQGQAVLYLGDDAGAFVEKFSSFGFCMEVSR